jgi:hypothetical protein
MLDPRTTVTDGPALAPSLEPIEGTGDREVSLSMHGHAPSIGPRIGDQADERIRLVEERRILTTDAEVVAVGSSAIGPTC